MNRLPSAHKGTAHSTALMHVLAPLGKGEGEMGTALGLCWEAAAMWWLFGDLGNINWIHLTKSTRAVGVNIWHVSIC